jgi:hypothetical protein
MTFGVSFSKETTRVKRVKAEVGTGAVCVVGSLTEDREVNKELRVFAAFC